jgi:hypothetical protein
LSLLQKREWSDAQRRTCAVAGLAMPNGDFPILDHADLRDAIDNHKSAKDPEAAQAHITGRAKSLGGDAMSLLPSDWPDSTRMADKLAAAVKTPFEASAHVLAHRLVLAKSAEARASVEADTKTLVRNLGATEAIWRAQRSPQSFLKIGAAS